MKMHHIIERDSNGAVVFGALRAAQVNPSALSAPFTLMTTTGE